MPWLPVDWFISEWLLNYFLYLLFWSDAFPIHNIKIDFMISLNVVFKLFLLNFTILDEWKDNNTITKKNRKENYKVIIADNLVNYILQQILILISKSIEWETFQQN